MDKRSFSGIKPGIYAVIMVLLTFVSARNAVAQNFFEGSVTYNISITGKDAKGLLENEPAKKMDLHIKDDNFIINLYEARIPRTFLYIGDSNHTYIVDMASQVFYLRDYFQEDSTEAAPKAEKVQDSIQVKNEWCSVYRVVKPGEAAILYYVTDKYRVDLKNYEGKDKNEAKADFLTPGLDGRIPLRKVIKQANLTITTEYSSITPKALGEANFKIPRGFKRKKRDPRK
ncbi:MAG: hypothetical protein H6581_29155 [Bacteroidia bacterium]|nr:hypothetical protein [Bacteroidia bacterium]